MARRGVVVAVLIGLLGILAVRATPPGETVVERAEVFRDGDLVIYAAKATGASAPSVRGDGYSTYGNVAMVDHYTIRLVDTPEVERLRPHLDQVVATMQSQVGQSIDVAAGTVPSESRAGNRQIDVRVSSTAPCSGQWLGCATPTISNGRIVSAQVWINPRLMARSDASIANGVRHELGHAFGLGHYDAPFEGATQTMHSTSFDATDYRSGDLAGLRHLAIDASPRAQPRTAYAPPEPQPAPAPALAVAPPADPTGTVTTVVPTSLGVVIRGRAVDPDTSAPIPVVITMDDERFELLAARHDPATGDAHGFEVVWSVPPGMHRVCVAATNVGAGGDVGLGCVDVDVTSSSFGQLGLQTL